MAKPPSEILLQAYQKHRGVPENHVLLAIAKQVLLPQEEVLFWLKHLDSANSNRKKAAKKAAEKRKASHAKSKQVSADQHLYLCHTCNRDEPPDEGEDEDIEWVACDSCPEWHNTVCVELATFKPKRWLCTSCK